MSKIKEFLEKFNPQKPDWSKLPEDFPNCGLKELTSDEVGQFNVVKTLWELSRPEKIKARSRVWDDPKGYQYLAVWQNTALLRILIRKFTSTLPLDRTLNKPLEYRLKAQMDDAARSVKRNIEEGWKRPTTSEYLNFLGYSQGSLEELRGDVRDCKTDGFLNAISGSNLKAKGFDLRVFKGPRGRAKGEPTEPNHPYYQPLVTLNSDTLTYEIFMELVNKTDWLLRKLVESLEKKLDNDQQYWRVEQARVESKFT